ncbi:hypothetical protein [Chryseobacterium taeanense]|uniref:hypothetical protein n=1 Tax=Chryseobacterium taeanense TaxID=311334 RepID=UPI0035B35268
MKNILVIIFFIFFLRASSQEKELLIDTVFIKSFSNEKIIETIKESKKQYKKYYKDFGSYNVNLLLTVDYDKISELQSSDFTFDYFKKKKYPKNTKESFYKDVKFFEFNPEISENTLNHLYNYPEYNYLNYFKDYTYKMREIEGILQVTCYSKSTNLKAVIILDKATLLPKAIYKNNIAPTHNIKQTFTSISKNTDSEVIFDITRDEATILYQVKKNKITISEIKADLLLDNYRIKRIDKKGELIFSKDLKNIISKINVIKNDEVY